MSLDAADALLAAMREAGAAPGRLVLAAALLATRHLRFDAADPFWADRDRLVFAGAVAGLADAAESLMSDGQATLGHRVMDGRLGLEIAAGLAQAERLLAGKHGRSMVDHRVWLFADAADLVSGAAQDSAWEAGRLRLGRLAAIVDAGEDTARLASGLACLAANGWSLRHMVAGSLEEATGAISAALRSQRPTVIVCRDPPAGPLVPEDRAHDPGEAPWSEAGGRGAAARRGWLKRHARHAGREAFDRAQAGRLPPRWHDAMPDPSDIQVEAPPGPSTAATLRQCLQHLASGMPQLARLDGSLILGAALHGGLVPFGAGPLGGLDAAMPALRQAASRALHVVQAFTEPEGGGADGQLAALRAVPGLHVYRPADASETIECLELALRRVTGPSVVLVSEIPGVLLAEHPTRTRCARGGYRLGDSRGGTLDAGLQVTLVASGQDLAQASAVSALLLEAGVVAAIVSLPCWTLFEAQDAGFRRFILGAAPLVAIEAGCAFGWDRWLGSAGLCLDAREPAASVAQGIIRHLAGRPPI